MRLSGVFMAVLLPVAATAGGACAVAFHSPEPPYADATTAKAFLDDVVAEAVLPPGGRHVPIGTSEGNYWVPNPNLGSSEQFVYTRTRARMYVVDAPPSMVVAQIEGSVPIGATVTKGTTVTGFTPVVVTFPVSGPHERFAQLSYDVGPQHTELPGSLDLVEARTSWLPSRGDRGELPLTASVRVVGFSSLGDVRSGPSGEASVSLGSHRARELIATLNRMPLADHPACGFESGVVFTLTVRPEKRSTSYRVLGCTARDVDLTTPPRDAGLLLNDATCALARAVDAVLPKSAKGTRRVLAACTSQRRSTLGLDDARYRPGPGMTGPIWVHRCGRIVSPRASMATNCSIRR